MWYQERQEKLLSASMSILFLWSEKWKTDSKLENFDLNQEIQAQNNIGAYGEVCSCHLEAWKLNSV